jgi:ABC-2 type transport system permease protein
MNPSRKRSFALFVTLGLVGANLIALNFLLSGWSTARVDLTSERLFSISPVTERLLTSLDEDLTIQGYFSSRTHPKLAPLVPQIADLLEEYRAVSDGRVQVEIADPGEDDAVADEAAERYGVRSTPFRLASKYEAGIVNAFFAIVVKYGDQYVRYGFEDLIQVDPTPDGDIEVRLRNLEYDLTRAIKKVVYGFRSTSELFERVEGPVTLTAVWTPASLPEMFAGVPQALRDAAAQIEEQGGEAFDLKEIDPAGDDALRQQVYERYGAQPMSLGLFDDREFYLYAILEIGGEMEQVPLAAGEASAASIRESIESALRRHTPGFLKTVGIVSPEPPQIPPEIRMQMQLPPAPPPEFEEVKRMLGEDYRVTDVRLEGEEGVPTDVDVLLVLKPTDLSEDAVYNLDQYLMRGGRVVLCAGTYSADFGMSSLDLRPVDTGLDAWLAHHGVTIEKTLVLDDRNQPLPIPEVRSTPFGMMRTWTLAPYPYLVQVREDGFLNPEVTASLDAVGIYWGNPITVDEERTGDALQVLPLLQSSERSWTSDDVSKAAFVEYEVPQETATHLLAAAVTGRFTSYFADRPAPGDGPPAAEGADDPAGSDASRGPTRVALERSPETRLVVVGNAQFLSDFVARALAQVDGGFFIENLRFVQNLIDWVSLDNDMLRIRSRGMVSRRLERVGEGTQVAVEAFNYAAPVLILFVVGAWLHWRRRQTPALTARHRASDVPAAPARRGEV